MGYFPLFVDLEGRDVLVIGGGTVALRKIRRLLPFGPALRVIARDFHQELQELAAGDGAAGLHLIRRAWDPADLGQPALVIVAVDDRKIQQSVSDLCRQQGVLCNAVDSPEWCSFIFPALVQQGPLTIGINTGGRAPSFSALLRRVLEDVIPADLEERLDKIRALREGLPPGQPRQRKVIDLTVELFKDDLLKLLTGPLEEFEADQGS